MRGVKSEGIVGVKALVSVALCCVGVIPIIGVGATTTTVMRVDLTPQSLSGPPRVQGQLERLAGGRVGGCSPVRHVIALRGCDGHAILRRITHIDWVRRVAEVWAATAGSR